MTEIYFKNLEEPLRHFFGRVCVDLSDNDPNCLEVLRGNKSSFQKLEYKEFIILLLKHLERNDGGKSFNLFSKHILENNTVDDLRFAQNLRNKYFHGVGLDTAHNSDDQMADLIVVRRLVRELAKLCDPCDETDQLLALLDGGLVNLIAQVAQVTLPDQFDLEGEKQILSNVDREFISEMFRRFTHEFTTLMSEKGSATVASEPHMQLSENEIAAIWIQLNAIETKLGPVRSLKGRMDGLEAAVLANVRDLHSTVESMYTDLRGGDLSLRDQTQAKSQDLEEYDSDVSNDAINDEVQYEWDDDEFEAEIDRGDVEDDDKDEANLLLTSKKKKRLERHEPISINRWQARDEMISLRKRIWKETGEGPSADGLLRKSMIDEFLEVLPTTPADASRRMKWHLDSVSTVQLQYLDDVCSIVSRVDKAMDTPRVCRLAT